MARASASKAELAATNAMLMEAREQAQEAEARAVALAEQASAAQEAATTAGHERVWLCCLYRPVL